MCVTESGDVFIAYYGNRTVIKVSPNGEVSDYVVCAPWTPHGVDVFEGELYVLESLTKLPKPWQLKQSPKILPRIRKIAKDGSVSVLYEYQEGN